MANASHVLKNGCCIEVYDESGQELIGYAFAEELSGGQKQRWLLKAVPGKYTFKLWKDPYTLTEWNDLVSASWTANSYYVVATTTVTAWQEGMDPPELALIEPVFPFSLPLNILRGMSSGTPAELHRKPIPPVAARRVASKLEGRPAPHLPHKDLPMKAPPLVERQIVIGDAQIFQFDDYKGYIFGATDIEALAPVTSTWQSGEYFLLKSDYVSAGAARTQTQILRPVDQAQHETLAAFQTFSQTKFGAEYPTYIVIGCNYYHGALPPSGSFLL